MDVAAKIGGVIVVGACAYGACAQPPAAQRTEPELETPDDASPGHHPEQPLATSPPAASSRRAAGAGVAAALADGQAIVDGTTKRSTAEPQQHGVADFLAPLALDVKIILTPPYIFH